MTGSEHLNVFKGPNSVRDYFDPELSPPLPLVEIPDCLNPYRDDGVRIYAKMMSMHPATNVKVMPGWCHDQVPVIKADLCPSQL